MSPADGTPHRSATLPIALTALAFLALYLISLNPWLNEQSLLPVAQATGWAEEFPQTSEPLRFLFHLPARLFPPDLQPVLLNGLQAVLASAVLFLLGLVVAGLPQDRTPDQRPQSATGSRGSEAHTPDPAWMRVVPAMVAMALLGLQSSFWESATAATGHMIHLLGMALSVWLIRKFQISGQQRLLYIWAGLYGVWLTNTWGLIGFLPCFLLVLAVALKWSFWQPAFLIRMFLSGLAGALFYLLMPLVAQVPDAGFWTLLKAELGTQKAYLLGLPRFIPLILSLSSLGPLICLSIRWDLSLRQFSPMQRNAVQLAFRVVHLAFLGLCGWVFFDPPYSARIQGNGLPMLSFYFLSAICVGYLVGYFLKVPQQDQQTDLRYRASMPLVWGTRLVTVCVLLAGVGAPAALLQKNWKTIQSTNSDQFRVLGRELAASIPVSKPASILFSSDPSLLWLLRATEPDAKWIGVQPRQLASTHYHLQLKEKHPDIWVTLQPVPHEESLNPLQISKILLAVASNQVCYAMPPLQGGLLPELFQPRPSGMLFALELYPTNQVLTSPLTLEETRFNEDYWNGLEAMNDAVPTNSPLRRMRAFGRNQWAAWRLLSEGRESALPILKSVQADHPDNLSAQFSRAWLEHLKAPDQPPGELNGPTERNWAQVFSEDGPSLDPRLTYSIGSAYLQNGMPRQSAHLLDLADRVCNETNPEPAILLGKILAKTSHPEDAMSRIARFLTPESQSQISSTNLASLAQIQVGSLQTLGKIDEARTFLGLLEQSFPDNPMWPIMAADLTTRQGNLQEALSALEAVVQRHPDSFTARLNAAGLMIQIQDYPKALDWLNALYKDFPKNPLVRINRGLVHRHLEKPDAALVEFEAALESLPDHLTALYNAGNILRQKGDFRKARKHLEHFLELAPKNTTERSEVQAWLKLMDEPKPSAP